MLNEARPQIREKFQQLWTDAKNRSKKRPTMLRWLTNYGIVGDTVWALRRYKDNYDGLHYAWVREGVQREPGVLITVWSERVFVDDSGTWFFEDNLDLQQTDDGRVRDELQRARTLERTEILRSAYQRRVPVDAILLENARTQAELQGPPHPSSKIKESGRDDQQWYVVDWKENPPRPLVARGPRRPGWRRPEDETAEPSGLGFPNQAHRDAVEKAAVAAVTAKFKGDYHVVSREKDCLGFDSELTSRESGEVEFLLEVKGTAGTAPHFFITRNEKQCGEDDNRWHPVIVTEALSDPDVGDLLCWREVDERFNLTAMAWHGELKPE